MMKLSCFMMLILFVTDISEITANGDDDAMDMMFRQRSQSDWEKAWHSESHSRCRQKLISHLYWACEKDIYRLTRRNQLDQRDAAKKRSENVPWLMSNNYPSILRTRRGRRAASGGSITMECCTTVGCTWEEYAEYCPTNKRIIRQK